MLNPNAQKWVAALRSGEYKQGKRALRIKDIPGSGNPDMFCCLGVACDLYIESGNELVSYEMERQVDGVLTDLIAYGEEETAILPIVVQDWLGLATPGAWFGREGVEFSLASKNDEGSSFQEIADIIESEPDRLFKPTEEDVTNG